MTIFRIPGAISGALTLAMVLSTPFPAMAIHDPLQPESTPADGSAQAEESAPADETAPTEHPAPAPAVNGREGFYFHVDLSSGDTKDAQTNADFKVDISWTTGLGLGVGYRAGPIRLEAEFFDHYFRVRNLELGPETPFEEDDYAGAITAQGLMASVFYDIPASRRVKPYLGAGYGFARVDAWYSETVCYLYCYLTTNEVVDDWDQVAAWQAMAGFTFPGWTPKIEWFIGYRYFGTDDVTMRTIDGVVFTQDGLNSHSVNGGFRFYF